MGSIEEAANRLLAVMGHDGRETFDANWLVTKSGLPLTEGSRALQSLAERGDIQTDRSPSDSGQIATATLLFQGRLRYQQIKSQYPETAIAPLNYRIFDLTAFTEGAGRGHQTFPAVGDRVWVDEALATVVEVTTFAVTPEGADGATSPRRHLEVRIRLSIDEA